ncbi:MULTISPECIES: hypothetical protein [unclassified Pseudomonas]|uniref:hypothetical protein n=1 Tax=unclassified Pseudomonas TaxID=196821 RepID=UPI000C8776CB|nr:MULTISPECIES: hypothetical protein [unclassified Pseudomonas]PMU11848.1 hypothetical protein C1Y11_04765 [Pseudomonas sp. FW305-20]PMU20008.1 hypothetical protein C1Y10_07790 [Pseudomonas sp. FW305-122]PMU43106.1 hypothetical protein C1Y12_02755 [Pseudomonas sp. FW305-47B]PMX64433.1 hypothetical protein C1Y13_03555 [Pseudomonas sp. FW305-33]PMX68811.1 hypothetical protein C1X12_10270 [Pseudomonas sp. FW305-60]
MESIFGFFESLFKNFTWGRLTFLAFSILLTVGGLFVYESYTGNFKLNRISAELKIVEAIVELEKKVESLPDNSPSKRYFDRLMSEAGKSQIEFNFQPGFSSPRFERIFYQCLPWALLLTIIFFTTSSGRSSAVGGVLAIGSPFIVLGYNLPALEETWVIDYLYPWGVFTLILIFILVWQHRKKS